MSYKSKYIHYKLKYLNLKNSFNSQTGGAGNNYESSQGSDSDSFAEYEIDKDALSSEECSTEQKKRKEINNRKTEPGRGILGDAIYYWVVNTGINKDDPSSTKKKTWEYKEPEIQNIEPEVVPYTEFDQQTISIIYNHSKSEYEEGFDIGYIIGYECGCNQNKNPEKKQAPGNISVPEFLTGFYDGWKLGFYKGTKYYYTTWIQINNNNAVYKKNLINYVVTGGQDNERENYLKDKSDPNYDPIEEKCFNEYYVYLKKKLIGKTHWFL
jgi:hypothetical protein